MELLPPAPAGPLPEEPWQEKVQRLVPEILQKATRTPSESPPPKRNTPDPGFMPRSKKAARSTEIRVETFEYA